MNLACHLPHAQKLSVVTTMCAAGMTVIGEIRNPGSQKRNETTRNSAANSMQLAYLECTYVDELIDKSIKVTYIPAHTGHIPGPEEHKFLPLPQSTHEGVEG